MKKNEMTLKNLVEATGCPPYRIMYYLACGYLPLIRKSTGPGDPNVYHHDAVRIIKNKMAKV